MVVNHQTNASAKAMAKTLAKTLADGVVTVAIGPELFILYSAIWRSGSVPTISHIILGGVSL
jgi:hypothetical protein